ncbi:hypothetical protein AUP68_14052 [Ilyonectria robusta]
MAQPSAGRVRSRPGASDRGSQQDGRHPGGNELLGKGRKSKHRRHCPRHRKEQSRRGGGQILLTIGSRDDQNIYTGELEAIAMALRCMPDGPQHRHWTVMSHDEQPIST